MQTDVKNLNDIMAIVKRRKWGIVVPALLLLIISAIVALVIPPVYRSTSTILIEDQEIPRDYVTSTVTGFAEQRLQTINQRIMSTPKLLEVINKFNLYADLKATRTTEEIIAKMRKDIKFETISADVIDPRTGRPTPATIAFSLAYQGRNAGVVQQVANVLASLYLEENLRAREQQTSGTSSFMESEMNEVKTNLTAVDAKIRVYKQQNINALPELAQLNYQELERADRDIEQYNAQLRSLKEREASYQTQLAVIPTDSASQDKTRLNELRVRLVDLRSRYSADYPDVRKTRAEIDVLEKRIKEAANDGLGAKPDNASYITISSQLSGLASEIESVKRIIAGLEKKRINYSRRIEAMPRVDEGYKAMLSERSNLQTKLDDLSRKFMEAKVAHGLEKDQKGERFTIIDAARLPEKPFSPNVPAIILIGLVLGIGAGVGFASLREYSDHSVRSLDALAVLTGFPVLTAIPEIVTKEDIAMVKRKRWLIFAGSGASMAVVLAVTHFLVMDLNILLVKVLRRMAL